MTRPRGYHTPKRSNMKFPDMPRKWPTIKEHVARNGLDDFHEVPGIAHNVLGQVAFDQIFYRRRRAAHVRTASGSMP